MTLGVALPARDGRDQEQEARPEHQAEREQAREAIELALASEEQREAENEQEVADHAAGERAAHDVGQSVGDGEQGDDQLGRIPERGVEEASDPRARVMGGVLGRLADQPGEGDQRGGCEHEDEDVSGRGAVDCDRDRRKDEREPEDASGHAAGEPS